MDGGVRASDAERGLAVEVLERALVEGRITVSEFEQRVEAAFLARTRGELAPLTADLPRSLW